MADNFQTTVESLFRGMDSFISTKTVVGEAITIGDTIVLPLVDVSFGVAASAKAEDRKSGGGGGMGGKMTPSAVIVIHNGVTRLVNIRQQDALSKILDMLPDLEQRLGIIKNEPKTDKEKKTEAAVDEVIHDAAESAEEF